MSAFIKLILLLGIFKNLTLRTNCFVKIINVYNEYHSNNIDLPFDSNKNTMSYDEINKQRIVCDLEKLLEVAKGDIRVGKVKNVTLLLVYSRIKGEKHIRVFILGHLYRYVIEPKTGYTTLGHSFNSERKKVYYIEKELSECGQTPSNFEDISIINCYI